MVDTTVVLGGSDSVMGDDIVTHLRPGRSLLFPVRDPIPRDPLIGIRRFV